MPARDPRVRPWPRRLADWPSGVGLALVALAAVLAGRHPIASTSTTISCGRRTRSSSGRACDPLPRAGPTLGRSPATSTSRTSSRSRTRRRSPARPAAVPAAARRSCCCRSSRSGASRPTSRRSPRSSARSTSGSPGGCSAACRLRARVRARDDAVLRLRDGLLVRGPARHDLVLRPRRRGHVHPARGRARAPARPGRRRSRTTRPGRDPADRAAARASRDRLRASAWPLDRSQFLAGLLLRHRLHRAAAGRVRRPFFMLVGGGGSVARRSFSAGLGAAIPVAALLGYNVATTGHVFHPGYDYLYQLEASGYPRLGYNPDWSIEDIRYIPQNLAIMLVRLPRVLPECCPTRRRLRRRRLCTEPGAARGLFDADCPIAVPSDIGMSLLLTSPAYLLALPAVFGARAARRLVTGAVLAVAADRRCVNLMHFSQGWVQFGYRFSNDFVPFALPLVALGAARHRRRPVRGLPRRSGSSSSGRPDQPVGRDLGQPPRMVSAAAARSPDRAATAARPPSGVARPSRCVVCRADAHAGRRRSGTPARSRPSLPLLGTVHPTGFPTYVLLGWLASTPAPAVRRAGVPDEPAHRRCSSAVAAGRHGRARRAGSDAVDDPRRVAAALGLGADAVVWRIATHADAHMLHLRSSRSCSAARALGGARGGATRAGRRGRPRADRWLVAAAVVFGAVASANHSLTLLLVAADRAVRARRRAGRPPRGRGSSLACAGARGRRRSSLVYLELPLRAGPFRAPLVYGRPGHVGWLLVHRARRASSGAAFDEPFADLAGQARRPRRPSPASSSGRWPCSCRSAFVVDRRSARPRYALLSGVALADHVLFAASYVNADIERYYLGPGAVRLDLARDRSAAAPSSTASAGPSATAGPRRDRRRRRTRGAAPTTARARGLPARAPPRRARVRSLLVPTAIAPEPRRIGGRPRRDDTAHGSWLDEAPWRRSTGTPSSSRWWSYSTPLWYAQLVEGLRPDIWIVDDRTSLDEDLGERRRRDRRRPRPAAPST